MRPLALFVLVGVLFSICAYLCGWLCLYVYVYCICAFMQVPIVNTCSALLLAGPGNMQLLQPHHYWTIGFANS